MRRNADFVILPAIAAALLLGCTPTEPVAREILVYGSTRAAVDSATLQADLTVTAVSSERNCRALTVGYAPIDPLAVVAVVQTESVAGSYRAVLRLRGNVPLACFAVEAFAPAGSDGADAWGFGVSPIVRFTADPPEPNRDSVRVDVELR